MKRQLLAATAALVALVAVARPAAAQVLTYELTNAAGNVPPGNITGVAPGGSVTFNAYLVADAAAQTLIANHSGMIEVLGKVLQSNSALVTSTSATAATPNPWQNGTTNGSTATAPAINDSTFGAGLSPAAFGTNNQLGYLLGTVTFNAGSTTGTETLTMGLKDVSGFDNGGFDGFAFDSITHSGTTTLTIAPVPEPSALALAGLAAVVLGRRRRRSVSLEGSPSS